jgi:hypothetical protein
MTGRVSPRPHSAVLTLSLLLTLPDPLLAQHAMHHGTAGDSVLAAARRAVSAIDDTTAARAAGYVPIDELGAPDKNPFQGQHWFNKAYHDTLQEVALAHPAFIMFSPMNGTLQRIAVAYSVRYRLATPKPTALGGDSSAMWHVHILCHFQRPTGPPVVDQVADTAACRSRGGTPRPRKTVMIHVWTDVTNPEGVYGHDNPALPYLALGLSAAAIADLQDPARSRDARALSLALGETYGARLENASIIERVNDNPALADSLRAHRVAIVALVSALQQADRAGDRGAFDRVARDMRAQEARLVAIYQQMAKTPEQAEDMRRQYETTLATSAMH